MPLGITRRISIVTHEFVLSSSAFHMVSVVHHPLEEYSYSRIVFDDLELLRLSQEPWSISQLSILVLVFIDNNIISAWLTSDRYSSDLACLSSPRSGTTTLSMSNSSSSSSCSRRALFLCATCMSC